jgi:transcriptional regulator of acetoin/glycerol metabolism
MSANHLSANNHGLVAVFLSVAMVFGESTSRADNWPSWRGTEHNGISKEKSPPIDWDDAPSPEPSPSVKTIDDMERQAIVNALRATKGNVREAAQQLGIGQATVYRRLKRFGLVLEDLDRPPDSAPDKAPP